MIKVNSSSNYERQCDRVPSFRFNDFRTLIDAHQVNYVINRHLDIELRKPGYSTVMNLLFKT